MDNCGPASLDGLRRTIAQYYGRKIEQHGATPLGVDWSCRPTQELRFVQLLNICDFNKPTSINDFGCGYGSLYGFLRRRYRQFEVDYLGIDMSPAMIASAQKRRWRQQKPRFFLGHTSPRTADYTIASGIFNVKLSEPDERWQFYVKQTLFEMSTKSHVGLAVNFLGPAHPDAHPIPELYRTSAELWSIYCREELGMSVELLQGYGMHEFTLLARHVRQQNDG